MKKFISMVTALVLGAVMASAATGATWKPFLHGMKTPAELADKVQVSLVKDPTGNAIIDPARCKRDGSCAKPLDYFEMFKVSDPEARLTDAMQVPAYLRTLEIAPAPEGEYWISCLRSASHGTFKPVLHCLSRKFKPGEHAWVNPKTRRVILASDCTNPVEKPAPPKHACAEIHFFARAGDTVARNAVGGGTAFADDCFAIKKVGDAEFRAPWKDSCASEHCTFAASEAFLHKKMWMLASYELEPGEYVLRVPASFAQKDSPYVTVLCLERTKMAWPEFPPKGYTSVQRDEYIRQRNEWIDGHSDSVNVWWNAYRVGSDGVPRATIYYTEAEVPATEAVKMYWRYGTWTREHSVTHVR
ncbi:hypothetical protein KGQ72_00050 [Patescibacteria group bacterium]|nr:hypothetical protein [Patescibacteria group bacterium]